MVIKKDPEELPDEVVDLIDVFDDINSPQYWVAQSADDLQPSLLILDGHSTIILYSQNAEDLHWEAIHEIGQYKYTPDSIGDGLVIFPHTFYLEFEIRLSAKKLKVNASFDGTGVRAITMPMNDVPVDQLIDTLISRVENVFSSVLKPTDDQLNIEEGEVMTIPDSVSQNLSYKLALIGINLTKLKIDQVTEIEVAEGEIHEEVFEVPKTSKTVTPEPVAEEQKRKKKKTKQRSAKKVPPPTAKPTKPPATSGGQTPPPSPTKQKSGPPAPGKVSSGPPSPGSPPAPGPKEKASSPAPPPSPGKGKAVDIDAEKKSPASIPPPPGTSKKSAEPSMDDKVSQAERETIDDFAEMEESAESTRTSASLYPADMKETSGNPPNLRHTHATWFSRMLPNRSYPLVVKISTEEMKSRKSVTNQATGEKRSEATDVMEVDGSDKLTIRPEFPGCLVVPREQTVSLQPKNISARFHVTPLALGTQESQIVFEQFGKKIHEMELETKVIRHRVSRISAWLGVLTSSLPALFAFMFDVPPSVYIQNRVNIEALANLGYALPALISAVFFGIAGGVYLLQKPKSQDKSVAFPN